MRGQPELVKELRAASDCRGWVNRRFGDERRGGKRLTAHAGTSLRDWAAELERRVRREIAVAVYFIFAVSRPDKTGRVSRKGE